MTPSQKYKGILASTHIDSHRDKLTKEALEKMVEAINSKDRRIRMGVDHRRDFPPKGRIEDAELVERDGEFYVAAFFCPYENAKPTEWDNDLIIEYFDDIFQFVEVEEEENLKTSISLDPQNFSSFLEINNFERSLKTYTDLEFEINLHGRKSAIPDPEIIFKLASSLLLYQFLKPTVVKLGEKIGEKIAENTAEEAKKFTNFIANAVREAFYRCIPKSRPLTVVFDLPGKPHIELIARTRDQKLILKGLMEKQLEEIKKEMQSLNKNVEIAKVQFLLSKKGNWQFNYLITTTGKTIGKKISFKKREKRLDLVNKSQKKGR